MTFWQLYRCLAASGSVADYIDTCANIRYARNCCYAPGGFTYISWLSLNDNRMLRSSQLKGPEGCQMYAPCMRSQSQPIRWESSVSGEGQLGMIRMQARSLDAAIRNRR
eukprot:TRINITY_DN10990_c0_g1_i15.p1 TRINITY_DN10990_c0_g1~~TRINITY_DN10990_c0_g1_i15.p1  ORF type:complete len:109 (+),score=1.16 TRINITY_DN10990_c0_g1_i15:97-423(+)